MSRRRAPRHRWQRTSDAVAAQGTFGAGLAYNAAPINPRSSRAGEAGAGAVVFDTSDEGHKVDTFVLAADGEQELTLTYLPVEDSWNVILRSLGCYETDDFTISGQTLTILDGDKAPLTGDKVRIQYDYLTGMPTAPQEEVPVGELYLALAESSGTTAVDSSGQGHDGEYQGTPGFGATSLRDDSDNAAVTFSGDDWIHVPWGSWMESTAITVEAFIDTTMTSIGVIVARDMIGSGWRLWQHRVTAAGKFEFVIIHPSVVTFTSSATVNDGNPHHVAAVVDGATVKLYVDGVLDTSTAYTTALVTTEPSRIAVGASASTSGDTPGQFFVGVIDEVGYYTTALSAAEIATLAAR